MERQARTDPRPARARSFLEMGGEGDGGGECKAEQRGAQQRIIPAQKASVAQRTE
jgi:hypothetical protein